MSSETSKPASVLFVDDEQRQREIISLILGEAGYEVEARSNPMKALELLRSGSNFDLIVTDLRMPLMDGAEFLGRILEESPGQVVVVLTAHGSVASAVDAIRSGAFDYLEKPLDREKFLLVVERAVRQSELLRENRLLHFQADERYAIPQLIGHAGGIRDVARFVHKVAPSNTTVMIYGETGTGKELVARAIHQLSRRSARPFFALNCASIPENLLESELFGYEKGAFTGAETRRRGLLEEASGSTLLLDEIGDMPLSLQPKLLRVLQEQELRRLGSAETVKIDVRVVSATRQDLERMMSDGRFREDLFYRLNTFPIRIPPLRDRLEDLRPLAFHFVEKYGQNRTPPVVGITDAAFGAMADYDWPGNVRELAAAIERAVVLSERPEIDLGDLPPEVRRARNPANGGQISLPAGGLDFEELERSLLRQALERGGGVIARAAPLLGMSYRTFQYRMRKYQIDGDGDASIEEGEDPGPDLA